ncbi:MAG TPA: phosphoribosyltransferase family protein [Candidatus Paceibacterota bacterium]|nr:phosphoribosyltransferase family protein [Candidatus Paceibacterota bacterium]
MLAQELGLFVEGHFVSTNGKHLARYINKDKLYKDLFQTNRFCNALARYFEKDQIEVVIGPQTGGAKIAGFIAENLSKLIGHPLLSINARKDGNGGFTFPCRGAKYISGLRALIVDDVATTGGSGKKVVSLVRECGGIVAGFGLLFNRGNVTRENLGGVDKLESLIFVPMESWDPKACPLCNAGMPVQPKPRG